MPLYRHLLAQLWNPPHPQLQKPPGFLKQPSMMILGFFLVIGFLELCKKAYLMGLVFSIGFLFVD